MAEAWRIARSTRTCALTGATIEAETPFYSALVEQDDMFARQDYSTEAWPGVDKSGFFSYWKNKGMTDSPEKKQPIDYDRLLAFFDSLESASEPSKCLLRYVLALILVRRRLLRLDDMSRVEDGDRIVVFDRRNGGRTMEIITPEAGREELERTQEKLNQLFDCDFDDDV